ncbi:MAG: hypothetical protein P0107_01540 [Nitrosomonas sp.]|nr:hypothetical protein [Nitrosomonas sp.]
MNPRELLLDSFQAAIDAADPQKIVPAHLPEPPRGTRWSSVQAKAAAAMARAVKHTAAGQSSGGIVGHTYRWTGDQQHHGDRSQPSHP